MNAVQRREKIREILKEGGEPISASALAKELSVSRQIIVGDIALLRATDVPISATPRGYILQEAPSKNTYTIACRHDGLEALLEELYTVVDNGGSVLDVIVEHTVYGQISGQLHIFSRYDADIFAGKLKEDKAAPLASLTGGVHLHTLICPNWEAYQRICDLLNEKGILFTK